MSYGSPGRTSAIFRMVSRLTKSVSTLPVTRKYPC